MRSASSSTRSASASIGVAASPVSSGRPSSTFSRTDAENSVASSNAIAMCVRSSSRVSARTSTPSSVTEPPVTS